LPFGDASFDVVYCHFLLLWVADAPLALREMRRVCRSGGFVLALAEPDYGGWVDYPSELKVGSTQARYLQRMGADPYVGRRLRHLFLQTGLQAEIGVYQSVWSLARYREEMNSEWELLLRGAGGVAETGYIAALREQDERAVTEGTRFVFVPVFYAVARVGV
ncbi:MAG: class I SAM-dependent methyltransferase, partial [Chloroflexota bacterium]